DVRLGFRMTVWVYDPYVPVGHGAVSAVNFHEVLSDPDFVICAAYATPETVRMMNEDAFSRMRKTACFINISRGVLVDEDALERALTSGTIAGAGLDVGLGPDEQPSLRLARLPNVIATPHSAALVREPCEYRSLETVDQIRAILAGRLPAHAVNAHRVTGWWRR